jgi:hypothetical protein
MLEVCVMVEFVRTIIASVCSIMLVRWEAGRLGGITTKRNLGALSASFEFQL